jgi:hypothetical protein
VSEERAEIGGCSEKKLGEKVPQRRATKGKEKTTKG